MCNPIFISHVTADDAVVTELREMLEARGVPVWTDSRELSGGTLPRRPQPKDS